MWIIESIVSILAIYFDFLHQILRLNLIVLWCFLLDGIILLPITAPTSHDESYPVNHCPLTVPRPLFRLQRAATEHASSASAAAHACSDRSINFERVAIAQQVHSKRTTIKAINCFCVIWYNVCAGA